MLKRKIKDSQLKKNNKRKKIEQGYPSIPNKLYFTIREVSELCSLKAYVLRYWEQEFPQLRPIKRDGNRRYYQHHDILLIRKIRKLLYEDGFTIEGARGQLSSTNEPSNQSIKMNSIVKKIIADLETVLQNLRAGDSQTS